jgi:hypothetical protein
MKDNTLDPRRGDSALSKKAIAARRLSEFAPRLVIRAGTLGVNESASSLREPIDESLRAR